MLGSILQRKSNIDFSFQQALPIVRCTALLTVLLTFIRGIDLLPNACTHPIYASTAFGGDGEWLLPFPQEIGPRGSTWVISAAVLSMESCPHLCLSVWRKRLIRTHKPHTWREGVLQPSNARHVHEGPLARSSYQCTHASCLKGGKKPFL